MPTAQKDDILGEAQASGLTAAPSTSVTHYDVERMTVEISDDLLALYHSIEGLEAKMLRRRSGLQVSMSEARLIQEVGDVTFHTSDRITVSQVAEASGIAVASATAGVNRLARRGILAKTRDASDGRRINVSLTRRGEEIYRLHAIFYVRMSRELMRGMTPEEIAHLKKGVENLTAFYEREALVEPTAGPAPRPVASPSTAAEG